MIASRSRFGMAVLVSENISKWNLFQSFLFQGVSNKVHSTKIVPNYSLQKGKANGA